MASNGKLTPSELTTVPGGQLSNATASAWNSARGAALRENAVTLTIAQPAGAYRSWATQLDMRANPRKYNITPGVLPGLPSDHGFGTCVDVAGGVSWAIANLSRFGFVRDRLNFNDPNHFRYAGSSTTGTDSNAIPEEKPIIVGNRMTLFFSYTAPGTSANGRVVAVDPVTGTYRAPGPWEVAAIRNEVAAGRALINGLAEPEWTQTFGPLLSVATAPVPAPVVNIDALATSLAVKLPAQTGSFTATDRAMLDDIANKGELGAALTNTVNLVNSHADANKAQIIQEIDTHSSSSLSPFTATITPVE